jgi:hypothetical protein
MKQTPPTQTQLLIRYSVPFNTKSDEAAANAASQLAEAQCWGAYEVRRAKEKRYLDQRPDGSIWAKYEVWGTFDVARLSAKVMARLEERAKGRVAEGSPQPKDAVSPLSEIVAKEDV